MGKTKEETQIDYFDKRNPHPLTAYVKENELDGMGVDCIDQKLIDEGYERFHMFDSADKIDSYLNDHVGYLLSLAIKLRNEKNIEDVKIIPNYLAFMSRHQAAYEMQGKNVGLHSSKGTGHVVYVKRKPNTKRKSK